MGQIFYYKPIAGCDCCTYSCDMIRYSLDFLNEANLASIVAWCDHLYCTSEIILNHYSSIKIGSYRHLFKFDFNECSCSLGLGFICSKNSDSFKGFVEFNPNKCLTDVFFYNFINQLFWKFIHCDLVRFDLAIDIPILKPFTCFFPQNGKTYSTVSRGKVLTEYLGRRNSVGFCKLYDKMVESNLDYPLTRLEITSDLDSVFKVFPRVSLNKNLCGYSYEDIDSTDMAILSLLSRVDCPGYYLQLFGRKKREKLSLFYDVNVFEPDFKAMVEFISLVENMKNYILGGF